MAGPVARRHLDRPDPADGPWEWEWWKDDEVQKELWA